MSNIRVDLVAGSWPCSTVRVIARKSWISSRDVNIFWSVVGQDDLSNDKFSFWEYQKEQCLSRPRNIYISPNTKSILPIRLKIVSKIFFGLVNISFIFYIHIIITRPFELRWQPRIWEKKRFSVFLVFNPFLRTERKTRMQRSLSHYSFR